MTAEQSSILLHQLGGLSRLQAMIGAHTFLRHETECALSFKFKAGRRFNYVKIWLNAWDLYDLVTMFESVTGLRLSLKMEDRP